MIAKRSDQSMFQSLTGVLALAVLASVCAFSTNTQAADVFTCGAGNGIAGGQATVGITATHDEAMQGFSLALSFDPLPLDLVSTDFTGTAVESILGGVPPSYVEVLIDNVTGTMTAGVIFGFSAVPPLNQLPQLPASPTLGNALMNLTFDIGETVLPGSLPLTLLDSLGSPEVTTLYSNDGASVFPSLVDGSVDVTNLVRYYFDPMVVVPGGTLNAVVRCDHPEETIGGFQLAITYDSAKLSFQAPSVVEQYWLGTDLDAALISFQNSTIEVLDVRTQAQSPQPGIGFLSISAQFDFTTPLLGQSLAPGDGDSLIRINFNVANNIGLVGQTATIAFTDGIIPANPGGPSLPPATNVVITTDGFGIPPILEDGVVQIVDDPSFIRGDVNEDGTLNLADPINLLSYLFSSGPSPNCGSAADFNDDGGNDISDAIYALAYLFTDGSQPPHPFPGCGIDSTQNQPQLITCLNGTMPCP